LDKKVKTQQQTKQKKKTEKTLLKPGIEPSTSRTPVGCLTSGPYSKGLNLKNKAESTHFQPFRFYGIFLNAW